MLEYNSSKYGKIIIDFPPTGHKGYGTWDHYYDLAIDELVTDYHMTVEQAHNHLINSTMRLVQE